MTTQLYDLSGRVAIVTGGSDGIGLATAQLLAARGAQVVLCGRRQAMADQAAASIIAMGGKAAGYAVDVADSAALQAMIADVGEGFGRIDMLVNNAMANSYGGLEDLSLADWRQDFAVNSEAPFIATQAVLPFMRRQGRGAIVNIASTCGILAASHMASYSASKAALVHFTAVAAVELARQGIRVNCIVPGQVETASTQAFQASAPEAAAKITDAIPMGRGGAPSELAEAIAFLLSDAASFITGVALPVDGGKSVQLYLPS